MLSARQRVQQSIMCQLTTTVPNSKHTTFSKHMKQNPYPQFHTSGGPGTTILGRGSHKPVYATIQVEPPGSGASRQHMIQYRWSHHPVVPQTDILGRGSHNADILQCRWSHKPKGLCNCGGCSNVLYTTSLRYIVL